jgi:hypothetical protein
MESFDLCFSKCVTLCSRSPLLPPPLPTLPLPSLPQPPPLFALSPLPLSPGL